VNVVSRRDGVRIAGRLADKLVKPIDFSAAAGLLRRLPLSPQFRYSDFAARFFTAVRASRGASFAGWPKPPCPKKQIPN
jgi:hypothetical protein